MTMDYIFMFDINQETYLERLFVDIHVISTVRFLCLGEENKVLEQKHSPQCTLLAKHHIELVLPN